MHVNFTEKEVKHFLTPKVDVIDTYVVEEKKSETESVITDFISFYTLPSSVLKHETIKEMKAAYLFYYVANKIPLVKLSKAALILAKKQNHDVFTCLNIMDNKSFLDVFTDIPSFIGAYVWTWQWKSYVLPIQLCCLQPEA